MGAHPQLSFLAVFLLALSEAVPVIGTVVPGSTLILAISALATAPVSPLGRCSVPPQARSVTGNSVVVQVPLKHLG